jgi:hypothetical protein
MDEVVDIKEWLDSNGISRRWADLVARQVKKEYPALGQAMKNQTSNRPELELVQLIDHVMKGRFPVRGQKY